MASKPHSLNIGRKVFARIAVFAKVLGSVLSFKSTCTSPWQPTFQDKIANLRERRTAAVPKFLSLGHLFHMAALNDSFWFCVSPATHLFSKASSEIRVYNGSMYGKNDSGSLLSFASVEKL